MDKKADSRDYAATQPDKYTFSVLRSVMSGPCQLLLTDHEKLIICYTCTPYPVWIWTPRGANEHDMERAYRMASENGLMNGAYSLNVQTDFADYLIGRGAPDGGQLAVLGEMLTYACPQPVRPQEYAEGALHKCTSDDIAEIVEFMEALHSELQLDQKDRTAYQADAEQYVREGGMFFWRSPDGTNTACCRVDADADGTARITLVYTKPEHRRQHYAPSMVYEASKMALASGYLPMLYTDANYDASNACYRKIGYKLRGGLCTVGPAEEK